MDSSKDLDRLDRATLRTWRTANIVGWWLLGAAIYNVSGILLARTVVQKIAYATVGWQALVVQLLLIDFIAVTAGWVVGRHVYRWPGIVGAATVFLPGGVFAVRVLAFGNIGPVEAVMWLVYLLPPIALAAIASRIAWGRRPSALRAAKSRSR